MIERIESEFLGSNVFVVNHDDDCIIIDAGAKLEELKNMLRAKMSKRFC